MGTAQELVEITSLLGRPAQGKFTVVVRHLDGRPVVIENSPVLYDGRPMPTLFWLVGGLECVKVANLEAAGGVRLCQTQVSLDEIEQSHLRYSDLRSTKIPPGHRGPTPYGGVGGTRIGVKCLHAHLAWFLVDHSDPVGLWVAHRIDLDLSHYRLTGENIGEDRP